MVFKRRPLMKGENPFRKDMKGLRHAISVFQRLLVRLMQHGCALYRYDDMSTYYFYGAEKKTKSGVAFELTIQMDLSDQPINILVTLSASVGGGDAEALVVLRRRAKGGWTFEGNVLSEENYGEGSQLVPLLPPLGEIQTRFNKGRTLKKKQMHAFIDLICDYFGSIEEVAKV